jgi:hypothetical protein
MTRTAQNTTHAKIVLLLCVFVAAITLLGNNRGYACRHTDWWEGFMKYAVEMIFIPSFIKIGSGIQKLTWGDTQTHRQHGDVISLLSAFQNKYSRLIIKKKREGEIIK